MRVERLQDIIRVNVMQKAEGSYVYDYFGRRLLIRAAIKAAINGAIALFGNQSMAPDHGSESIRVGG